MEALSFEWLLAIGIVLVGLEALVFSFFLFPIGLGFLVVAFLELWVLDFESLFSQVATVFVIGLIITLVFRKKFIEILGKSSSNKEKQIHTSGIGTIDGTQIKFEGTYWNTNDDLSSYSDGDRVNIEIIKNKAVIKT
jgi:membrane protein implicated in regulation of membrane protease activity